MRPAPLPVPVLSMRAARDVDARAPLAQRAVMQARRVLPLLAAVLMVFAAGCASHKSSRAKQRFRDVPGSFGDWDARSAYVGARTKELTRKGLNEDAAAARAQREWFARAPVAAEEPTAYEYERRKAQADLDAYLTEYRGATKR